MSTLSNRQVVDLICATARNFDEANAISKAHGYELVDPDKREWKSQEQIRVEKIIKAAVHEVIEKVPGCAGANLDAFVCDFSNAAFRHSAKIIEAAKFPLGKISMAERLKKEQTSARMSLAHSLKAARRKERELLSEIENAEERLVILRTWELLRWGYPEPPEPTLEPTVEGVGLPCSPGIYFFWRKKAVRYVGQSIRLNQRVRLFGHHALEEKDRISWVEVPINSLDFAEAFYIGILRPDRNFGQRAKWRTPPENANGESRETRRTQNETI